MISADAPNVENLQRQLCRRAGSYFPQLADRGVRAKVIKASHRRYSSTYRISLDDGDHSYEVFVKVPVASTAHALLATGNPSSIEDRPRLVPLLPVDLEVELEHSGLCAMMSHFDVPGDMSTQVPKVLDYLEGGAIVIETIDLPTLAQSLRHAHRGRANSIGEALLPAFYNVGKWLKRFHEMPVRRQAKRLSTRDGLIDKFGEIVAYLGRSRGHDQALGDWQPLFTRLCHNILPSNLRLATGHGDFGLHNVFVDHNCNVVGFDTLAYWQIPPCEDVAYFLLLLETMPPLFVGRTLLCRRELAASCRREFLNGYFQNENMTLSELKLFEILVAMDKWVAAVHSCRRAAGIRRVVKKCRLAIQQRALRTRVGLLFAELKSIVAQDANESVRGLEAVS